MVAQYSIIFLENMSPPLMDEWKPVSSLWARKAYLMMHSLIVVVTMKGTHSAYLVGTMCWMAGTTVLRRTGRTASPMELPGAGDRWLVNYI
jgi:hypothetical protein